MEGFCTCGDTACPLNPRNHDKGCTPCIRKNLREGEIPSCFFNAVSGGEKPAGYTYRDFAALVLGKDAAGTPQGILTEGDD